MSGSHPFPTPPFGPSTEVTWVFTLRTQGGTIRPLLSGGHTAIQWGGPNRQIIRPLGTHRMKGTWLGDSRGEGGAVKEAFGNQVCVRERIRISQQRREKGTLGRGHPRTKVQEGIDGGVWKRRSKWFPVQVPKAGGPGGERGSWRGRWEGLRRSEAEGTEALAGRAMTGLSTRFLQTSSGEMWKWVLRTWGLEAGKPVRRMWPIHGREEDKGLHWEPGVRETGQF